jgi:hypothetical protein
MFHQTSAAYSDDISAEAIKKVIEDRFDRNPVSFDPSDMEANNVAASMGSRPVSGGAMPREMWTQARKHEVIKPAGKVFPTPRPYGNDGPLEEVVPEHNWTGAMKQVAKFSKWAANVALGIDITIKITKAGTAFAACYGGRQLTFNSLLKNP